MSKRDHENPNDLLIAVTGFVPHTVDEHPDPQNGAAQSESKDYQENQDLWTADVDHERYRQSQRFKAGEENRWKGRPSGAR